MRILIACLFGAAGCAAFFFIFNRVILHCQNSALKLYGSLASLLLSVLLLVAAGYITGVSVWAAIPATVLILFACVEIHHVLVRYRCRAQRPVETTHTHHRSWRHPLTTCRLAYHRYELPCRHWTGRRLRIVHVSDWHFTDGLPESFYHDAVARIRGADPDIVLMTGDFVTDAQFAPMISRILAPACGRIGTFAILGNHDYWADPAQVRAALHEAGVTIIGNGWQRITVEGTSLVIAGCEAPWSPDTWTPAPPTSELVLMLTHTPDNIYRLAKTSPFAVFAGHLHAGQAALPLLGPPAIPSRYGRRFVHGHFNVEGAHLFVSSGVGASSPPIRILCHPEVVVIDLLPDNETRA